MGREINNIKILEKKYTVTTIGYGISIFSFLVGIIGLLIGLNVFKFKLSEQSSIFLILFSMVSFILLIWVDKTNEKMNFYKRELADGSNGLIAHYGDLGRFKLKEKYLDFFYQFTRYEAQVLAIQTYTYNLVSKRTKVEVKLTNEYGYVAENVDMNAIIQGYYNFNKRDLIELKDALFQINIYSKVDYLLNFITHREKNSDLFGQTQESIALVEYAKNILKEQFNAEIPSPFSLNKVKKIKRLGIVTSIINYEYFNESSNFSFTYNGVDKQKNDRHYLTFIVESATGEKRLYLIVYRVEQTRSNDDIINIGNDIAFSFKKLMKANNLVDDSHILNYENKRGFMDHVWEKFKKTI